jgi:hypothetical protein
VRLALAVAALLALAGPAPAAVRLDDGPALALAAAGGQAFAVVESGPPTDPFALVRSSGTAARELRVFGTRGALFPDVAAGPGGRIHVSWGRSISAGEAYFVATGVDEGEPMGTGTGPGRLFVGADGPAIAYPDRDGNAALSGVALTFDAPFRRHLVLDHEEGYVLDMAQTQRFTELRVVGRDAPRKAVDLGGGLRPLDGTLAVAGGRLYVAYTKRGQAMLASADAAPDAEWSVQELAAGGITGGAAVVRARGRTVVAFAQRGDILVHDGSLERLTRGPALDADPLAAADPETGEVFVAWTRTDRRSNGDTAMLDSAAAAGTVKRR